MTRIDFRPWVSLALCVAVLAYVGCSSSSPTRTAVPQPGDGPERAPSSPTRTAVSSSTGSSGGPAGSSGGPAGSPDGGSSRSRKPLANLGNPAAVLIVTGQRFAYLEPCGCTEGQIGGLLRNYDLLDRLHNQNRWPTAQIDLGSLIKDPAVARGGFEQAKLKFDYSLRALDLMKYSAMALSAEDLKIGVGEALSRFDNYLGKTTKVVVANVQPAAGNGTSFRPSLVVSAGPVKLGITAVIDPDSLRKLIDPDQDAVLPAVQRPEEVLPAVLADLEPKSDYQVLMVQGPPGMAKRLAEAYPGFDIVVATAEFVDPLPREADRLNGGKTWLINVGQQGKHVGAFGLYPSESERLRYQLVTLDKKFDGPATAMKTLIEDEYRDNLRQVKVVEGFPRHAYVNGAPGATFVGADSCESCHPKTYEKWASTGHATAFESLVSDHKPNTIYDAECITCHTTGLEYHSGWRSEAETPHLAGNQCENCHGPGSKHIAEPTNVQFSKLMVVSAEQADKNGLCTKCHDLDNSPHFDFEKYYKKIIHKGLDTYNDPKVRLGVAPKVARSSPAAAVPEDSQRKQ